MSHPNYGTAQPVTDAVERAMKFLKDRPMPQPKAENRRNMHRARPANPPADGSPSSVAHHEDTSDKAQPQAEQSD